MNVKRVTRTGRRNRERQSKKSEKARLTAALPAAILNGWLQRSRFAQPRLDRQNCGQIVWIRKRWGHITQSGKGKRRNFSAAYAHAVTTSFIIHLIIINYYQRTRGPLTLGSQRGFLNSHRAAAVYVCVCACVGESAKSVFVVSFCRGC